MTRQELIAHCLTYPDAYEDYPFGSSSNDDGAWTVMRHRGNNKSFALLYERGGLCINLKCEPMRADFLRGAYQGVTPAYHMNKQHWNTVRIGADVPEDALLGMIGHSYRLTMPKDRPHIAAGKRKNAPEEGVFMLCLAPYGA